jgi:hypothetical protein
MAVPSAVSRIADEKILVARRIVIGVYRIFNPPIGKQAAGFTRILKQSEILTVEQEAGLSTRMARHRLQWIRVSNSTAVRRMS